MGGSPCTIPGEASLGSYITPSLPGEAEWNRMKDGSKDVGSQQIGNNNDLRDVTVMSTAVWVGRVVTMNR